MCKRHLLILILLLFLNTITVTAQYDFVKVLNYRSSVNIEFSDSAKSPLNKEDIVNFKGLDYFEIDTNYCVKAFFKRTPYEVPFPMKTTTSRTPVYVKYGELVFSLGSNSYTLNLYKNVDANRKREYDNYLFLPFTDLTNGNETYGGGRYFDLPVPDGDTVTLDFNMAYNPYCAYNHKYSCPIPPAENNLMVEIKAGVKAYKKH